MKRINPLIGALIEKERKKHPEMRRVRNKEKGPGQLTTAIILGRGTLLLVNFSPVGHGAEEQVF